MSTGSRYDFAERCVAAGSYHVTAQGVLVVSPTHKQSVRFFPCVDHSDVVVAILNKRKKLVCDISIGCDQLTNSSDVNDEIIIIKQVLTPCGLLHCSHDTVLVTGVCEEKN